MQNNQNNRRISPIVMIIVAILVIIIGGGLLFARHKQNESKSPITSFIIKNSSTNQSSSDFAQEQMRVGDTAIVSITYKPELLHAIGIKIVASGGLTARTIDPVQLDGSGRKDITVPTSGLSPDIYKLELTDDNQQVIDFGELTLTPADSR